MEQKKWGERAEAILGPGSCAGSPEPSDAESEEEEENFV